MMAREVYERYWDDRERSSVAAYVAPGHDPAAVTGAVRRALAGRPLQVVENRALRQAALRIFDRTFAVTEALRVLAVVVAFIGVWSALLALQVERTREIGTLLALGLLPRQLWGLTLLETGLVGLAAGLLSLPTGLALAADPDRGHQRPLLRLDHATRAAASGPRPGARAQHRRGAAGRGLSRCCGCNA